MTFAVDELHKIKTEILLVLKFGDTRVKPGSHLKENLACLQALVAGLGIKFGQRKSKSMMFNLIVFSFPQFLRKCAILQAKTNPGNLRKRHGNADFILFRLVGHCIASCFPMLFQFLGLVYVCFTNVERA